jgi:hypothetical protein
MQKWEYLFISISIVTGKMTRINFQDIPPEQQEDAFPFIQNKADDGWELHSFTQVIAGYTLVFKRPKD